MYADEYLDAPREGIRGSLYYRCKTKDEFANRTCTYYERAGDFNEEENTVYKTDHIAKAASMNLNRDIVHDPTLQKRNIDKCVGKANCPG